MVSLFWKYIPNTVFGKQPSNSEKGPFYPQKACFEKTMVFYTHGFQKTGLLGVKRAFFTVLGVFSETAFQIVGDYLYF